jgi:hypothetical protein
MEPGEFVTMFAEPVPKPDEPIRQPHTLYFNPRGNVVVEAYATSRKVAVSRPYEINEFVSI